VSPNRFPPAATFLFCFSLPLRTRSGGHGPRSKKRWAWIGPNLPQTVGSGVPSGAPNGSFSSPFMWPGGPPFGSLTAFLVAAGAPPDVGAERGQAPPRPARRAPLRRAPRASPRPQSTLPRRTPMATPRRGPTAPPRESPVTQPSTAPPLLPPYDTAPLRHCPPRHRPHAWMARMEDGVRQP
jgi:hypothetical protein